MSKELVEAIASLLYPPLSPEAAREKARAALSAIEREGFKVAPVEPTEEMIVAGGSAAWQFKNVLGKSADVNRDKLIVRYRAMLSAIPKQE